jgi:hypothetical protein
MKLAVPKVFNSFDKKAKLQFYSPLQRRVNTNILSDFRLINLFIETYKLKSKL